MLRLGEIPSRNQFGDLLNSRNLLGTAVEIGTHRGEFAKVFITSWKGGRLCCIDPWTSGYDSTDPASRGDRVADHKAFQSNIKEHRNRVTTYYTVSAGALHNFPNDSIDFVYIDGNHQPNHVTYDTHNWWEKVKSGGIMAGHDFVCPGEPDGGWGQYIQPIVLAFAEEKSVDVYLVPEPDNSPWSWYLIKP